MVPYYVNTNRNIIGLNTLFTKMYELKEDGIIDC